MTNEYMQKYRFSYDPDDDIDLTYAFAGGDDDKNTGDDKDDKKGGKGGY